MDDDNCESQEYERKIRCVFYLHTILLTLRGCKSEKQILIIYYYTKKRELLFLEGEKNDFICMQIV